MDVNGGAGNATNLEEFVDLQLSAALTSQLAAMNDRSAGNVAAANRGELDAHRAYQEALHLFRVLRSHMCPAGARRLSIRIEEIGNAMHGI